MADWPGRLRTLLMSAPDPARAISTWAVVLGGNAAEDGIELGDGTQLAVVEGPDHALVEMQFDASPDLMIAVERAGAIADDGQLLLRDPDGWAARFSPVEDVAPMRLEGSTLSHCTLLSPDPMAQCGYWQRAGFRLSDTIGEVFGWLRPNPVHHSLAFAAGRQPGIQHLAVELPDAAALIRAVDALVAGGGEVEFGPGRHLVGGNLFAYFVDDTGIRWELCAELQREPMDQPTRRHAEELRARSVNVFGPRPPASFIEQPGGPGPLPRDRTAA